MTDRKIKSLSLSFSDKWRVEGKQRSAGVAGSSLTHVYLSDYTNITLYVS